jgi:exopolysaccharide production protein ExoQ
MTPIATSPATESVAVLIVRRPSTNPLARARREKVASAFPWLLFFAVWLLLFPAQNQMDAPAHPVDEQSSAELAQDAQEGNVINRIVVITLGTIGGALLVRNRARIRFNGLTLSIVLSFYGWTSLSVLWADDPSLTGRRLIALAFMFLFSAGCVARMNADTLTVFIAGIPALNLIPGVMAEIGYGKFQLFGSHRFGGTAPHPNVQAATLSVACILLCWLVWRTRGSTRIRFAVAAVVVSAFLVLTGSRTSILAVLAALAFSFILTVARDHKRLLPVLLASCLLFLGLGGLFVLSTAGSGDPFAQAMHRNGDDNDAGSFNGRVELWQQCLKFVAKRPLLGYGYGGFWTPKRIEAISQDQTWAIQQSHSAYIEQLLASGIPGAVLYIGVLFTSLWVCVARFLHGRDAYGAWAAVLVFIAIHNVTESINVAPLFTSLTFELIVLYLAIVSPNGRSTSHTHPVLESVTA